MLRVKSNILHNAHKDSQSVQCGLQTMIDHTVYLGKDIKPHLLPAKEPAEHHISIHQP